MSYWESISRDRFSRRRALKAGAVGAGMAALLLAGCGGGGGGDGDSGEKASGLLTPPKDSTSKAKPGGTYKGYLGADAATLDPVQSTTVTAFSAVAHYTYPRLIKFKSVNYPDMPTGEVTGDLAESYEVAGDRLSLTLKLRKGLKWDERAPTSGRVIDAQDVVTSFNRFSRVSPYKADLVYSDASPASPIESMSVVDPSTVQVKMKQPNASLLELLGASLFFVMPKEADGGYDPRATVRGYGPYLLEDYRPSSLFVWKKNPDYYVKGRPFFDRIENPIVSEYSAQMAQFRVGSIYQVPVKADDIIQTKKDVPALLLQQQFAYPLGAPWFGFGYEGDSPFKDERVRLAVSNLMDRAGYYAAFTNSEKFQAEGLEVPQRWNTVVASGWEGFWIDPQNKKEFGENAKYFDHDIAAAKKLMDAAGLSKGVDTEFHYPTTQYPPAHLDTVVIFQSYLNEAGIRTSLAGHEYAGDFLPNIRFGYANRGPGYKGILHAADATRPTCALQISANFHKDGARFRGASPNGLKANEGDPFVNNLIDKAMTEFDRGKQQELVREFIRYATGHGYTVPSPYTPAALGFDLAWPVVGNYGWARTISSGNPVAEANINQWIDDTQPPIKTA